MSKQPSDAAVKTGTSHVQDAGDGGYQKGL